MRPQDSRRWKTFEGRLQDGAEVVMLDFDGTLLKGLSVLFGPKQFSRLAGRLEGGLVKDWSDHLCFDAPEGLDRLQRAIGHRLGRVLAESGRVSETGLDILFHHLREGREVAILTSNAESLVEGMLEGVFHATGRTADYRALFPGDAPPPGRLHVLGSEIGRGGILFNNGVNKLWISEQLREHGAKLVMAAGNDLRYDTHVELAEIPVWVEGDPETVWDAVRQSFGIDVRKGLESLKNDTDKGR